MIEVDSSISQSRCPFGDCPKVYEQKYSLKEHLIKLRLKGGDTIRPEHDELWRSD